MTVSLISCASTKGMQSTKARDLYCSPLFRYTVQFVEATLKPGDSWWIISAKHGLLSPETIIEPYDLTIHQLTKKQREHWASCIAKQLLINYGNKAGLALYGGRLYCKYLIPVLTVVGFEVHQPFKGLGCGQRLQLLKKRLQVCA